MAILKYTDPLTDHRNMKETSNIKARVYLLIIHTFYDYKGLYDLMALISSFSHLTFFSINYLFHPHFHLSKYFLKYPDIIANHYMGISESSWSSAEELNKIWSFTTFTQHVTANISQ